MEASKAAAPPIPPVNPRPLLELFLEPARNLDTAPAPRLDAYRALLDILEGCLGDHEFARVLHREWIKLSAGAPTRRSRRQSRASNPASRGEAELGV